MIQVKRLGHATFTTPDLERQLDYWTQVIGLCVVARDKDRAVLATKLGQECVALERGTEAGALQSIAFQVAPGSDLGELAAKLQAAGVKSERRSGVTPGVKDAIAFHDPKGTLIEVYAGYEFAPDDGSEQGVNPVKFGHVAYRVHDVQKLTSFYCDILGFRVSDWMGDHFSFLRCGVDHAGAADGIPREHARKFLLITRRGRAAAAAGAAGAAAAAARRRRSGCRGRGGRGSRRSRR